MGQLGWIDFSPTQRAKTMTVLDLLSESGTVDELGVGIIRDALADLIFPGFSTIQTRAKYFLLIPYIIHDFEKERARGSKPNFSSYLNKQENIIMDDLTEKYPQEKGIIGSRIAELRLKYSRIELARRPFSVY